MLTVTIETPARKRGKRVTMSENISRMPMGKAQLEAELAQLSSQTAAMKKYIRRVRGQTVCFRASHLSNTDHRAACCNFIYHYSQF